MNYLYSLSEPLLLMLIEEARYNLNRDDLEGGDRTDFQEIVNEAENIILTKRGFKPKLDL